MDLGRKITDLEKMENVPEGTSYLAEAGDGSGTKQIEHKKLVETISKDINLGNLKDLDTHSKESVVKAINEVNEKAEAAFTGTDGIKAGTSGGVPAPKPEEAGYVLGANGKWVPNGEGGSLATKIIDDREELEANTEKGMLVDALVVKDLNDSLGGFTPVIDPVTGRITGYKTKAGADAVFPFSGGNLELISIKQNTESNNKKVIDCKSILENYQNYTADDFIIEFISIYRTSNAASYGSRAMEKTYNPSDGILTLSEASMKDGSLVWYANYNVLAIKK